MSMIVIRLPPSFAALQMIAAAPPGGTSVKDKTPTASG